MVKGHFIYKGLAISQHELVGEVFNELIKKIKPKQVLEIGTSFGGLTLLIRDLLNNNGLNETKLITYDVNEPQYLRQYINEQCVIDIRVKNLFNHQYDKLENAQEVIDLITSEGTTLVLCDGGSKKNEFRLLSDFLKKGDVIMAHDYAPNEIYFNENIKNKIWNWLEIQDSDINDSCVRNNLLPYMDEEFKKVVWVCKIKN